MSLDNIYYYVKITTDLLGAAAQIVSIYSTEDLLPVSGNALDVWLFSYQEGNIAVFFAAVPCWRSSRTGHTAGSHMQQERE